MEDSDPQTLNDHRLTESQHPIAQIIYLALGRISIFGSVGVRLISGRGAKAGVEEKQALRLSKRALRGVALGVMSVYLVVAIPNLLQANQPSWSEVAASETKTAVTQAMVYAHDKGVYPTSIRVLVVEGYMARIPDKDRWGNDYVLSPVLTEGRTPRKGDNVYIYSRGWKGTGVYPQPFTHDTGEDGSIGYSSVHGPWGPPRNEFSEETYMLIAILIFWVIGVYSLTKLIAYWIDLLIGAWGRSWIVLAAICNAALLAIFAATGGRSMGLFLGLVVGVVFWFFLFLLAWRRKADSEGQLSRG